MGLFRILLWLTAFGLGAAISYYNWSTVPFHYLAGRADVPLIALLFGAFTLGAVVMWLLDVARLYTLSRDSRRQQRQIVQLEAELKSLRNLPLQPGPATAPPPAPTKDA